MKGEQKEMYVRESKNESRSSRSSSGKFICRNSVRRTIHNENRHRGIGGERQVVAEPSVSVPPQRDVLEPIDRRWRERAPVLVLLDAAGAIARGNVSREAPADGAFARQTLDVGDAGEGRAVRAQGAVGIEWHHAATAAFEITRGVDALPSAGTTAKDAACCPSGAHLRARAAANPAPLRRLANRAGRGTRAAAVDALALADDRRRFAPALGRVSLRERRESVRASESAGVSVDTSGGAMVRVVTVC